jgi:hypothetical protein
MKHLRIPRQRIHRWPSFDGRVRHGVEAGVNLRRSSWILVAMICFAVAKLDARQSPRPDKDAVRIDAIESSEQLQESLQEKSPLQFASNRAPALTISKPWS